MNKKHTTLITQLISRVAPFLPFCMSVIILLLCAWVLFSIENPFSLDDGLRHFAMGVRMRTVGITTIGWGQFLPYTILPAHGMDPWFGADLIEALLSPLGVINAIKAFTLIGIGCVLAAYLWVFSRLRFPVFLQCLLLPAAIFFEPVMLGRLLIGRPFLLITALLVLSLGGILTKRAWIQLPVAALSLMISQLFVFPVLIAGLGCLWYVSIKKYVLTKRTIIACMLGCLIGLLLVPGPLAYLQYLAAVFLQIPFLPVTLGGEMQFGISGFIYVATVALVLLQIPIWQKTGWKHWSSSPLTFLNALMLLFLIAFCRWERAVDVLWPIMILSYGVIIAALFHIKHRAGPIGVALLCIAVCISIFNVVDLKQNITDTGAELSLAPYADTAKVLPTGALIINPDWDDFAPFIALRPDLHFVMGIDPSFTYLADPEGYRLLHLPFEKHTTIALTHWLTSLQSHYPADFLILERERHKVIINGLQTILGLHDLAQGKGVSAVFSMKEEIK